MIFDRPGVHKEVTFTQGQPTYASSTISDEQLGKHLLRHGLLSPTDLTRSLQVALADHKTLAETVVHLGLIEQRVVNRSLERLIRSRLLELFSWKSGRATFHPGNLDAAPLDMAFEPLELVNDGIRQSANPYGATGWLVRKATETLILTGEKQQALRLLQVSPEALRFLDRFATPLCVKEVIDMIGRETLDMEEIAWAILVAVRLGYLAVVSE
jgi:hypothetical protein